MSTYATQDDVERILIGWTTTDADALEKYLTEAQFQIESVLKRTWTPAEFLADLDTAERDGLTRATVFQMEYMLHMGPAFFIEGSGTVEGPDSTAKNVPKLAPKAKQALLDAALMRLTGRIR